MTPPPSSTTSSLCKQRLDQAFAAATKDMPPMPMAPSSSVVETGSLAAALATPFTCLPDQVSVISGPTVVTPFGNADSNFAASGGVHPHHVAAAFPLPDPLQSAFSHIPEHVR
eukprot:5733595-Karenia_brevis.AAC.1